MTQEEQQTQDITYKKEQHCRCNFCGKSIDKVFMLIAGPSVNICNECLVKCLDILTEEIRTRETKFTRLKTFDNNEE